MDANRLLATVCAALLFGGSVEAQFNSSPFESRTTQVARANPTATQGPNRIIKNLRDFIIPFEMASESNSVSEVHLYVSNNQGQQWQLYKRQAPSDAGFPFRAGADGEYWFAVRTIGRDQGFPDQSQLDLKPELIVVVDQQLPRISMRVQQAGEGKAIAEWRVADDHLDAASFRLQYQDHNGSWQDIPFTRISPQDKRSEWQSQAQWWLRHRGSEVLIRAEVKDHANNSQVVQKRLALSTQSTNDFAQDSGDQVASTGQQRSSAVGQTWEAFQAGARKRLSSLVDSAQQATSPFGGANSQDWGSSEPTVEDFAARKDQQRQTPAATNEIPQRGSRFQEQPDFASTNRSPFDRGQQERVQRNTGPLNAGQFSGGQQQTAQLRSRQPAITQPRATQQEAVQPGFSRSGNTQNTQLGVAPLDPPQQSQWQNDRVRTRNVSRQPASRQGDIRNPVEQQRSGQLARQPARFDANTKFEPVSNQNQRQPRSDSRLARNDRGSRYETPLQRSNSRFETPRRTVRSQVNRPVSRQRPLSSETRDSNERVFHPRITSIPNFELVYDLYGLGDNGQRQIELWYTRDRGRSWELYGADPDAQSPMQVELKSQGLYGFQLTVDTGRGQAPQPPQRGDDADVWVLVDWTKPTGQLGRVELSDGRSSREISIEWTARDTLLAEAPISLSYSDSQNGPWTTLARDIPNSGAYYWRVDQSLPERLFIQLEVRDMAGNVTYDVYDAIGAPGISIRDVRFQ